MKEKWIEKGIIEFLENKGAVVEWMQSWSIMVIKWKYQNKMNLQKEWCPDITCFYKWEYIWIEVKKDREEVEKWLKVEKRFNGEWKPLPDPYFNKKWKLCDTYKREKDQIKYKNNILKNWWTFILTYDINEVMGYISEVDKKSKLNLQ